LALHERIVVSQGHLIDSDILSHVLDTIIAHRCRFKILELRAGRTNEDFSIARLQIIAGTKRALEGALEEISALGCTPQDPKEVTLVPCPKDGAAPADFYSTTNQLTWVFRSGEWRRVEETCMDSAIVVVGRRAACRKLRDLRKGDPVVCGIEGVRVEPVWKSRDRAGFAFMREEVSSERRAEIAADKVAQMMRDVRRRRGSIVMVAGPVVVHTGGAASLAALVRAGYVQALLTGNALLVHDIELAMLGTSLGIDLKSGRAVSHGHSHHMRAINAVRLAGGIQAAIRKGLLRRGIAYQCFRRGVPVVSAGSIRDDGPLPETIMDIREAQDRYRRILARADLVLMMASMLHSIGAGNLLPAWTPAVCVDINPAVVTKLCDRGSAQAVGVVTDVGLFLHLLVRGLGVAKSRK
jgi:lysine-ketoglutarate reductase/saccharopine dehydrogenase-like protein (TIGR00300 family)